MATIKGRTITYEDGTTVTMEGQPHIVEMRGGFYVVGQGFMSSRKETREEAERFLDYMRMV